MTRALVVLFGLLPVAVGHPPVARPQGVAPRVDSTYSCVMCHAEHRRAFISGVHAESGIKCRDCHGGDPTAFTLPAAHRRPFLGRPTKVEIANLCASCHSDPHKMRQYGLPADQLAALRTSRHGQLLDEGNQDAPTCTDCHEAHTILRSTDARSATYPPNIPVLCARCHANRTLMAKYGLPTDQLADYTKSAHGVALYQDEDFAAPTCIGCHGSHSALPPGVTEVTDVCGRCHALIRQAFTGGPHGRAAVTGSFAGCLGCHSNHQTERVPVDSIAHTCDRCHPQGSRADTLGRAFETRIAAASVELASAQRAIDALVLAGRNVTDARLRYQVALTAYQEIAQVQHSLDLDALEDLGLRVASATRTIRDAADVATEQRWEHKLLLIPVWFLALAIVVLAWFRLSEARRRPEEPDA
jgi:hypothetical protein